MEETMSGSGYATKFNPVTIQPRMVRLTLATALMTVLLGPNLGQTQPSKTDGAVYSVVVINRSVTKLNVTVWDENQARKTLLNTTMEAGQEVTVQALAKPTTKMSWKAIA